MAAEERGNRNLPEELQEEILRRLPVKSLIRFESVSETWRSKFHSRRFIELYGRRSGGEGGGGAICNDDNPLGLHTIVKSTLLDMIPGLWDPQLLQSLNTTTTATATTKTRWYGKTQLVGPSSNGIYCLIFVPAEQYSGCFGMPWVRIGLCNPATRGYKLADPFPAGIRSLLHSKPGGRLHHGFGKIRGSNDYKVVVIVNHGKSFVCLSNTLVQGGGGEWKKVVDYKRGRKRNFGKRKGAKEAFESIINIFHYLEACPQKLLEGCWHWAARGGGGRRYVLSFNFGDESFELMGAPVLEDMTYDPISEVFVLHDRLAFINVVDTAWSPPLVDEVDVWMMMEYGVEKSWNRIYSIIPLFHGKFRRLFGIECAPLRGDEDEDEEESGVVIRIKRLFFEDYDDEHRIISCDNAGHKVHGLWDPTTKYFLNNPGISTYVETLESL